jgi:hypothetical protein
MVRRGFCISLALTGLVVSSAGAAPAQPLRPAPARATSIAPRSVRSESLSFAEQTRLVAGDTVARPMVLTTGQGRYVGGLAYQVVRASPAEVLAALGNAAELPLMLPRTKAARLVDVTRRGARVELTSGTSLVETTYTVVLKRATATEVRFRLDPSRPHGIRDLWGYVRVKPLGKGQTLVTMAVALDVGPGLVRALFEDKIQRVILDTPRRIRDYLEPKALARSDSPAAAPRM